MGKRAAWARDILQVLVVSSPGSMQVAAQRIVDALENGDSAIKVGASTDGGALPEARVTVVLLDHGVQRVCDEWSMINPRSLEELEEESITPIGNNSPAMGLKQKQVMSVTEKQVMTPDLSLPGSAACSSHLTRLVSGFSWP